MKQELQNKKKFEELTQKILAVDAKTNQLLNMDNYLLKIKENAVEERELALEKERRKGWRSP